MGAEKASLSGLTNQAVWQKKLQKTRLRMAISLIRILREGPLVSFNGSPTVSPITAALCSSLPFFLTTLSTTSYPDSMYFLALSQAPPVFEALMASYTPLISAPGRRPSTKRGPKNIPVTIGVTITKAPGAIISVRLA